MGKIGHGYGSEWHLLRYLGYHRKALDRFILKAIGGETSGATVYWVDNRFSSTRKALHDDCEFGGVDFDQPMHISLPVGKQWREYWPAPASGIPPQWDAVGRLSTVDADRGQDPDGEWLLVEAKAHLGEMESSWQATAPASQAMIRNAMAATAKVVTHRGVPTDAWLNKFYQYANRLAVLNFLCQTCTPAQPARLIFIYFYGETMPDWKCPQSATEWQAHLDTVHSELDLDLQSPLMQRVHHVYLPINLVAQRQPNLAP